MSLEKIAQGVVIAVIATLLARKIMPGSNEQ